MPGQAAMPILGGPCLGGVTSPQPWWPQWAVGAQCLPATLAVGAEQFRSLPRTRPCQC